MSEPKKKFVLEFDEPPAFIFVSEDGANKEHIYLNGEKIHAWTGLELETDMEEVTNYEIKGLAVKKHS